MPGRKPELRAEPLVVRDLSLCFTSFELNRVSLTVEPGEVAALLGHNGAGKTTTLRLIMGMVRKDGGSVRVGGLDHTRDERAFKIRVGFVPEEGFFYGKMRVKELLAFVADFYPGWDAELCARLAKSLNVPLDKRLGELSKGTRTKVSLLAAVSHHPDVLLLDEPTSGLDPRSRAEVLRLMKDLASAEGRGVLFSTHNLHEVEQIADRVVVVQNGSVIAHERLQDLRRNAGGAWSLETFYLEVTP